MLALPILRTSGLALLLWGGLFGAEPVRYILAPTPLLADPAPDSLAPKLDALSTTIQKTFERSIPLDSQRPLTEDDPLSPKEATLVILPRITAVRSYQDRIAGTLDQYKILVVGEIAVLDPWSMGRLYAATRMVLSEPKPGRVLDPEERKSLISNEFQKVIQEWAKVCFQQIQQHAHPFVLTSTLLPERPKGLKRGGGIWPFGSLRGVTRDSYLNGDSTKHGLRVREVFERFSVVEDIDSPNKTLNFTEAFALTVLRDGEMDQRKEPRLQLRWRGQKNPEPPDKGIGAPLTHAAWLGLAADYLSKDGHYRVLPILESENDQTDQANQAWKDLRTLLKNKSKSIDSVLDQQNSAGQALEDPDILVELGVLDAYHGSRPTDQGGTENLYRNIWGLAWSVKQGEAAHPVFSGYGRHTNSISTLMKANVREIDGEACWFLVCRDGLVDLIEQQRKLIQPPTDFNAVKLKGKVLQDRSIEWERGAPPDGTPLECGRPMGEVRSGGQSLGYYIEKKRDGLRWHPGLANELDPGDELLFSAQNAPPRPLVSIRRPEPEPEGAAWLLEPDWIQVVLAQNLKGVAVDLAMWDEKEPAPGSSHITLRFGASPPFSENGVTGFKSVWRLRLYPGAPLPRSPLLPPGKEPLFKIGRERTERFSEPPGRALFPPNRGVSAIEAIEKALSDLVSNAKSTGLERALIQEQQ